MEEKYTSWDLATGYVRPRDRALTESSGGETNYFKYLLQYTKM